MGASNQKWYDITLFSSDAIIVEDDATVIAEMYFRIKTDAIVHARFVYSVLDWLGSIGGVEGLLIMISA